MPKSQHEQVMYKLGQIESHLKALNNSVGKHDTAIDGLEKNQNKFLGATAVLSTVFLFVGGVIARVWFK